VVKVWDLATGEAVRTWDFGPLAAGRGGYVLGLSFAPDGRTLATGNTDTTIFLLDVP